MTTRMQQSLEDEIASGIQSSDRLPKSDTIITKIPTIAASWVYNVSLFASYSRGDDPRLHGISGLMASNWHLTPSKDS